MGTFPFFQKYHFKLFYTTILGEILHAHWHFQKNRVTDQQYIINQGPPAIKKNPDVVKNLVWIHLYLLKIQKKPAPNG